MWKNCIECWKENENKMLKLCKEHYYLSERNKPKTRIKQVSDKKKARLKETGGERELFRQVLIERQHDWLLTCEYCWKDFLIEEAQPVSCAHILSKGLYWHLRLLKTNIAIVCPDLNMNSCHTKFDSATSGNKRDIEQRLLNWETIKIKDYI